MSIGEDITKIREQVQGMISEALLKRATANEKRKRGADILSSDGGLNSGMD